jgi:hypothetical protein
MSKSFHHRFARAGLSSLLLAAIGLSALPTMIGVASSAYAAEALRPEIGKPLQEAQGLIKAKKYKEALSKIREADSVGGKKPEETFMIERMRASAAQSAGEYGTAAKAFEAVIESGRLPAGERLTYMTAIVGDYYQLRDYSKVNTWLERYFKEGGNDAAMRELQQQSSFLSGNYKQAGQEAQAAVLAAEKAGRTPSEGQLQMWANTASKLNDKGGYVAAIEKLVAYYPKKEYWVDLLNRVQSKPGYSDRLSLDLFRLKLAAGQLSKTADYMEMAQLALQAGFPAEAMKVIDQGYKSGALGTGADAERHKRLKDLATKSLAESEKSIEQSEADANASKEGTDMLKVGYAYVTMGKGDKGLNLMTQGIKKDSLKHPDDAKLHLGIAQLQAGKKSEAIQTLKSVRGNDGTADLARYWVLLSNRSSS